MLVIIVRTPMARAPRKRVITTRSKGSIAQAMVDASVGQLFQG